MSHQPTELAATLTRALLEDVPADALADSMNGDQFAALTIVEALEPYIDEHVSMAVAAAMIGDPQ